MRILHITPSYKPAFIYGGPIFSVGKLCESQVAAGAQVSVYTTTANGAEELPYAHETKMQEGVSVTYFPRVTKDHSHLSPALWQALRKNLKSFDAVHIHSWWNFPVWEAVWACRLAGIRPLLSPRGMLSPFTLQSKAKTLFHHWIGRHWLKRVQLHATTAQEARELGQYVPGSQAVIAPNIIELPAPLAKINWESKQALDLLFLSRIHPKKGIEPLFQALAKTAFSWHLTIAGEGEDAYIEALKTLAKELGLEEKITWYGWADQEAKRQLFAQTDLFVLTSHNENFANVVIESLALGVPVLLSKWVGLSDYVTEHSLGWITTTEPLDILEQLEQIAQQPEVCEEIRNLAPSRIHTDFDALGVAKQYLKIYQEL